MVSKQNIGNAGEYYVASILSARDFVATLTLGRAERYDLLAVNPKGKTMKISVKTRYDSNVESFPLSIMDEKGGSDDMFYAFVKLNDSKKEPDYWIIPSKRVNELLSNSSKIYFSSKKKNGGDRKDAGIRNLWLTPRNAVVSMYPANWTSELNGYYKNTTPLENLV